MRVVFGNALRMAAIKRTSNVRILAHLDLHGLESLVSMIDGLANQSINQGVLRHLLEVHARRVTGERITITSAHQFGERLPEGFAFEVPEGHVDAGHGTHHDATAGEIERRLPHVVPEAIDGQRVESQESRGVEAGDRRLVDLGRTIAFPPPDRTIVGDDLDPQRVARTVIPLGEPEWLVEFVAQMMGPETVDLHEYSLLSVPRLYSIDVGHWPTLPMNCAEICAVASSGFSVEA